MQFSSNCRNRIASAEDVVRTVTRRVEGIRLLLNSKPTEEPYLSTTSTALY